MKTKTVKEAGRAEKSSKDRKTWVLSVRLSLEERENLARHADAAGSSLSEYARDLLTMERDPDQMHLPFTDVDADDDDGQGVKEEMEEFLSAVAQSARGLAAGWVRCKMLPKLERMRKKKRNRSTCDLCLTVYETTGHEEEEGMCGKCASVVDTVEM